MYLLFLLSRSFGSDEHPGYKKDDAGEVPIIELLTKQSRTLRQAH